MQTYSSIYRSSIDMILKITLILRYHKICIYVFIFNSKYHYLTYFAYYVLQ